MSGRSGTTADRGSATIWTAAAIAAIVGVLALMIAVGGAAVARHRAVAAADLAALAAAAHAGTGETRACERARWVTDNMRAQLTICRLHGRDARIEVTAEPPPLLAGFGAAHARARAGPAPESGADTQDERARR
ncbi:secretion/DNA translocation related TadE-like protein [Herbihabitans rhizosphaerae]|uniref:Secretion/DNA translocation related TadE-like protein n=1 Tax=Herbihabitans rhizosphaerae TaxID=1872711 RepID=A0A4Q7KX17_9PSEU|nr:Rv3654c family TadE-like protein [Herbihabitans rhizosphaerae]RZS41255.1 secretion/DNA translocation related TadE-like protein [Herbihabitans rhizosphaerae]